ncbi:MAG: AraC family transcriptional regulator [Butyrivibrio sp.]|nr:AraC family transcriptional regulator [Butyrivibrio sp.]
MYRVLRGGCNTRHPSTFVLNRPKGLDNYVLLIIKSPAVFNLNGVVTEVAPDTGLIIDRNTCYSYGNPNGVYMDDWLHVSIDGDHSLKKCPLKRNTFFKISDSNLFTFLIRQLLFENLYTDGSFKEENTDCLMQVLINHIKTCLDTDRCDDTYGPYYSQLRNIRISMQSSLYNPQRAADYAMSLGISTSHFQHLYTDYFGISFQKDYIRMRIDYAKDLLETTDLPMEVIAENCGYHNDMHFYRQFKESTNMTPAHYRKHFRNLLF